MKSITWSLAVGALLLSLGAVAWLVMPGLTASNLLLTDSGVGYDPLTSDEANRALAIALGIDERKPSAAEVRAIVQPMEVLLVERYDAPKGSPAADLRQGEVYLYDYTTDTLIHTVVDVATGSVQTKRLQGVQLPLTIQEEARAVDLILADKALWHMLSERYELITGDPLEDMTQLEVKVSLFLADAMPDQVNEAAQACGQHRCAQVLLFTVDRTLLEVLPIVDLSEGRVIQLLSDSWIEAS